jgi:phosphate butyryltransferase
MQGWRLEMVIATFEELIHKVKKRTTKRRVAIACAADAHTLEAVLKARKEGICLPMLVGDKNMICSILKDLHEQVPEEEIYDEADLENACHLAVKLIREQKADFLMKGNVDTNIFLKAVVNKETGLGKGGIMSHFAMFEVPNYHKLLIPVDGGMVTYPTLEQKKAIIQNTVATLLAMGYDCPKVGVLACVEKVNPKLPETVEADALKQMNLRGEIKNCIIEGPISYDCALDKEIADLKGFKSEVAGDADVLLAPNIHTGNIMGKMLSVTCKAKMAGFVVGAKCPVVMLSRGSTAEEKYLSLAMSAAVATSDKG